MGKGFSSFVCVFALLNWIYPVVICVYLNRFYGFGSTSITYLRRHIANSTATGPPN